VRLQGWNRNILTVYRYCVVACMLQGTGRLVAMGWWIGNEFDSGGSIW